MNLPLRPALVRALALSLMIHAALLLGVTDLVPIRFEAPATPIQVVMTSARPGETAKPAVSAARPAPDPARSSPERTRAVSPVVSKKSSTEKLAVAEQPPRDFVVPASPSAIRETVAPSPVSPATTGQGGSMATEGRGAPKAAPPARQEGVAAEDLRQYRTSLAMAARRFKRYPPLARERGWEGTAEIALNFTPQLPVPNVVLLNSSGQNVLDEQAIEMVRQAVRATPLPEGLKGRDFRVPLPVKFSLEEEGGSGGR